ncbi:MULTISPECIES: hypothetical protein [unclassified Mesorhizobium]|uniref:hypothetical protein n=1 Tax=unclassified Mesorhizobium TaxID=325217 RepID=UPI0032AEC0E3
MLGIVVVVELPLVEVPLVVWAKESPADTASTAGAKRIRFFFFLLSECAGCAGKSNRQTEGVFPDEVQFCNSGRIRMAYIRSLLKKTLPAPESMVWLADRHWRPVAIMATVLRRVTEDRVSVSIPGYDFPHSIIDHTQVTEASKSP